MKKIMLKSGNTFEIQPAAFEDAMSLTQAVASELASSVQSLGLKIPDGMSSGSIKSILQADVDIGSIMSPILRLIASKEVYRLLWPCFAPCLYDGEQITPGTFDDARKRPDFLPCVVEIFKENVVPFIKGLDFKSLTSPEKNPSSQK